MAMGGGIMDFVQRFRTIQMQRHSSEELIQDLLVYAESVESKLRTENQNLISQLRDAELDLTDATKSRRELQQQLQLAEGQSTILLQENTHLKNHNPYILVLIDGDGLLFAGDYIRQGVEGGKRAAYALRSAILQQCGEHAAGIEVIAKVYANLSGLAKAMRRDGSLENESDLKDFSLGFSQGKATFDFVDVGHGKERADNKIKETARWHLRNYNCKQVLLGISHDAGYAPFLDELFQDSLTKDIVTVIEGYPTVRELVASGVRIMRLDDSLFRSDKLVDRIAQMAISPPVTTSVGVIGVTTATATAITSAAAAVAAMTATTMTTTTNGGANATSSPTTSSNSTPAPAPAATYARAISSASPPPQITLPLQPRPAATPARAAPVKPAPWNPGPRGLDPPLQVSQSALDSIKKRKDSNKLCNNHYLRGPCSKGDSCCFEHKYKPTKDEINAIAFLTRLNPCENGQECDVENCIYGHHCPSVNREGICTHPFCKFQIEDHPPGTKFRGKTH
ncbi:hypothetical protein B0T16DRAFT_94073 [Cercophora newfieldiana]|uniref:C3H1-type domain-containing protein n=1 Tax=Cercophora newfieldiana TaxID=92897 RepID=A0AA40CUJ8_9PEZI|nr:hypothetical protein B0T16DRAFT_94073 [Cercophora newfieldiana]